MTRNDWDETAKGFASYVGKYRLLIERGAVPLQFKDTEELPLVVGVFGNDDENGASADREVELVRQGLEGTELHEIGFGHSADGAT